MFNIGFAELIVILLVAFVVVGPKDLPRVARTLGRWVKTIKRMFNEFKEEAGLDDTIKEFKDIQRDVNTTVREIDPRKDIQAVKTDTDKVLRQAKDSAMEQNPPGKEQN